MRKRIENPARQRAENLIRKRIKTSHVYMLLTTSNWQVNKGGITYVSIKPVKKLEQFQYDDHTFRYTVRNSCTYFMVSDISDYTGVWRIAKSFSNIAHHNEKLYYNHRSFLTVSALERALTYEGKLHFEPLLKKLKSVAHIDEYESRIRDNKRKRLLAMENNDSQTYNRLKIEYINLQRKMGF